MTDRPGVIDRLVSGAFGLLLAALAVYAAVRVVAAVWAELLIFLGVSLLFTLAVLAWRARRRGW